MPLFISPTTGNFTVRRISFGALGDSYYEYLLKMWLLQGKQDDMYRSMWETVSGTNVGTQRGTLWYRCRVAAASGCW
jgi:mannosyl-oligosaccharide alpha-1,2-mannosidase